MKKIIQICFITFFVTVMTACGGQAVEAGEQQETVIEELAETIEEEEPLVVSKSPLVKENSTTIASEDLEVEAEIENITGDEAIQLLSQIDTDTLELDATFEEYDFVCDNEFTDIDGMPVYCIKAYSLGLDEDMKDEEKEDDAFEELQEAVNVYYVTLDGNAMFKVDYTKESYINLETGEVIEYVQMSNS